MRYLLFLIFPLLVWSLELKPNGKYLCYVAEVVDGDTVKCRFPFDARVKTYPVRLIGIDTPETGLRKKNTGKQAKEITFLLKERISRRDVVRMGLKAKRFTEKLLFNVAVLILETDVETFDRYHRILGYLWLPDGKMLNEEIICNGYALPLTVPPNVKYQKRFLECFKKALKEGKGLWKRSEN